MDEVENAVQHRLDLKRQLNLALGGIGVVDPDADTEDLERAVATILGPDPLAHVAGNYYKAFFEELSRRKQAVAMVKLLARGHYQDSVDGLIRCQCSICEAAEKFITRTEQEWK